MPENRKSNFLRILRPVLLLLTGAGILILSVSAIGNKSKDKLSDIKISITGAQDRLFVTKADILSMLESGTVNSLKNQSIGSLNLTSLEKQLLKNKWIKKAELFIDNSNTLQVNVEENSPVARVFTTDGNSFYVSATSVVLPLSDRLSAELPVFTGLDVAPNKLSKADSAMIQQIVEIGSFILNHDFWMAQVDQVNINSNNKFELIPKLGNQIIRFGTSENYEEKFNKLLAFYKQVQLKTGWNRYSVVDLRYQGQVVAEKRDAAQIRMDSIASIRIMKNLIEAAKSKMSDTTRIQLPSVEITENVEVKSPGKEESESVSTNEKSDVTVNSDNPPISESKVQSPAKVVTSKPVKVSKPAKEKANKDLKEREKITPQEKKVPKAVMPPKEENDEQY